MITLIKKIWNNRAFRYLFFGGLTTLVNLVVFNVLCYGAKINYTVANIISVATAIIFAYVVNKLFVFDSRCSTWGQVWAEFYRFILGRLSTMVIEVGGVYACVQWLGQAKWLAKLETQFIVVIVNYFISKLLVFKHVSESREG